MKKYLWIGFVFAFLSTASAGTQKQLAFSVLKTAQQINDSVKTKYVVGVGVPINPVLRENLPKLFYIQSSVDFAQGALWVLIKDKNVLISDVVKSPSDQTVQDQGAVIKKPDIGIQFIVDGYAQLCEIVRRPEAKNQLGEMKLFGQCEPEACQSGSSSSQEGSVANRSGTRKRFGNERECRQNGGGDNLVARPSAKNMAAERGSTSDRLPAGGSSSTANTCKPYQETPNTTLNSAIWSGALGADPRRSSGESGIIRQNDADRLNYGTRLAILLHVIEKTNPGAIIHLDVVDPPRGSDPNKVKESHVITDPNGNFPNLYVQVDAPDKPDDDKPKEKDPKKPDEITPPKQEPPKTESPSQEPPKEARPKPEPLSDPSGAVTNLDDITCPAELDGCNICQGPHCEEMGSFTRIHLGYKDPFKALNPSGIGPYANPGELAGGSSLRGVGGIPDLNPRINPADDGSTILCNCGTCVSPFASFLIGEISIPSKADLCKEINSPECNGTESGAVVKPNSQSEQDGVVPTVPTEPTDPKPSTGNDDEDSEDDD